MDVNLSISQNLRKLREQNGYTQKEIAELLNCTQVTYSNYETGRRCISIQSLIKLAKFYKVSTDYIIGISNDIIVQSKTEVQSKIDKQV